MQLQLEIPVVIPKNEDCAHCRLRLQEMAGRLKGVETAELSEQDRILSLNYDPNLASSSAIEREVQNLGIELERSFAHDRLRLQGLDCADCAATIEKMLSRKDGVLWVAVNFPASTMEVEYDPERIDPSTIGKEIEHLGYAASSSKPDHRHTNVFYIPEMDCDEEIALIRKKLGGLEGVLDLEFNLVSQKLIVVHRTTSERIEEALREIKMTPHSEKVEQEETPGFWATHKRFILTIVSGLLTAAGFVLSLASLGPEVSIPV
ncbi:MAG: cation transporter [Spirochaetia bacterium]